MREIRLSGSVRGVRSDPYPYRDMAQADAVGGVVLWDAGPDMELSCCHDARPSPLTQNRPPIEEQPAEPQQPQVTNASVSLGGMIRLAISWPNPFRDQLN